MARYSFFVLKVPLSTNQPTYKPSGRLPLPVLSSRPVVTFLATECHLPLHSTKLYSLVKLPFQELFYAPKNGVHCLHHYQWTELFHFTHTSYSMFTYACRLFLIVFIVSLLLQLLYLTALQPPGRIAPLPPLDHIWDVMLVWRKGISNKTVSVLQYCLLYTIIIVHKDTSSSYRLVNFFGFDLVFQAPLCLQS